jgi:hypothetical protein
MIPPNLKILWLHRRPFLLVMCLTFLAFAILIFTMPKLPPVVVRSSIEIGSAAINQKQEPLEAPEHVAMRVPAVYGPAALVTMAKKGVSPSILTALQNPIVESIGRFVVVANTVDTEAESAAKEFQETTADQIIKELGPRSRALREAIAARISLAARASDSLALQIKADAKEVELIGTLSDDLRVQLEKQRANLAALYQRTGMELQPSESATVEAHIRELHEQISSQTTLIGSLSLERSHLTRELGATHRLYDAQARAVADAQFEQSSFIETHISLPPSSVPATRGSRRLSLLVVAFALSVMAGFGAAVLLHNLGARKI